MCNMTVLIYTGLSALTLLLSLTAVLFRAAIPPVATAPLLIVSLALLVWPLFSPKLARSYGWVVSQPMIALSVLLFSINTFKVENVFDWLFVLVWSALLVFSIFDLREVLLVHGFTWKEALSIDNLTKTVPRTPFWF